MPDGSTLRITRFGQQLLSPAVNWSRVLATLPPDRVRPGDRALLSAATAADVRTWPPGVRARLRALMDGTYRAALEAAGWEVDLLLAATDPPPSPPPGGVAVPPDGQMPRGAPPGTARIAPAGPGWVSVAAPAGPAVRDLPGATWDPTGGVWRFPVTRRVALALRAAFTGVPAVVDPKAAAALRAAAAAPAAPDVTVRGDRVEIRFEHTPRLQAEVKRLGATWDGAAGCWHVGVDQADRVEAFTATAGLLAHPAVAAAAARLTAPFDYDGTVDGLRGVPVTELRAVRAQPARGRTPALADRLAAFGVHSVYDLLSHVPLRYLDRSATRRLADLPVGEEAGVLGRVTRVGAYDRARRLVRVHVDDGSATLTVTFFHAPWVPRRFHAGDEVAVHGRLDAWAGAGRRVLQMTNPVMDRVGEGTALIVPVYPQSAKTAVSTWDLHAAAMEAVRRLGDLLDPLPAEVRDRHQLMARAQAYRQVHHPDSLDQAAAARRRLAFDELFRMQLVLGMRRAAVTAAPGVTHQPTGQLTDQLLAALPFGLTDAQHRVVAEILTDLRRPHPMHRLLQGDVGSGKTLVAALCLLAAVEGGHQGALMAPTEILATQLHRELTRRLAGVHRADGRPVRVELYAAKTTARVRRDIHAGVASGAVDIVVGTHAVLGADLAFANLGVVVVDEQHRFGVEQRAALRAKGDRAEPDTLVMTATPIPRTAALTVFGDLDVSVLDQLPPGRTPVRTRWLPGEPPLDDPTADPWDTVRAHVGAGRQAYVVASLVEDNENIAARSAQHAHQALTTGALAGLRLGLVHGRQDRAEREATMAAFTAGDLDVLVATTVIEVGVDVPNATVMVVLDAARFGIAQLHQIRGRVGRGAHPATCILTGAATTPDAAVRMQALCESTDGFHLAEVDLNLRGEGSLFGARQSGQNDLRVADLRRDRDLVAAGRAEARALLDSDPSLTRRPGLRHEVHAALGPDAVDWLGRT